MKTEINWVFHGFVDFFIGSWNQINIITLFACCFFSSLAAIIFRNEWYYLNCTYAASALPDQFQIDEMLNYYWYSYKNKWVCSFVLFLFFFVFRVDSHNWIMNWPLKMGDQCRGNYRIVGWLLSFVILFHVNYESIRICQLNQFYSRLHRSIAIGHLPIISWFRWVNMLRADFPSCQLLIHVWYMNKMATFSENFSRQFQSEFAKSQQYSMVNF